MVSPMLDAQSASFAYPTGFRLALLMVSIFLGMFLVALVRSQGAGFLRGYVCVRAC